MLIAIQLQTDYQACYYFSIDLYCILSEIIWRLICETQTENVIQSTL